MKQEYASQERYNKLKERANREIALVKGDVWEITKHTFSLVKCSFTRETKIIEIISEPYQGMVKAKIDGVERDYFTGLKIELLKYKAKRI